MLASALVAGALALSPPPGGDTPRPASPEVAPSSTAAAPPPEPSTRRRAAEASPPATATAAPGPGKRGGRGERARRRRDRKPAWSWRFVGAHYGAGVMASLLVLPGSYALAGHVGHRGKGLSPVIGAMLIGAFLPSPLIYTTQWAVGRRLFPRRERFWPGLLASQAGHLAVFAGAVMGGASFHEFRDAAPVVLTDALATTALASLTAEATRRPKPVPRPELPELTWERYDRLWRPRGGFSVIVPIVKVNLP